MPAGHSLGSAGYGSRLRSTTAIGSQHGMKEVLADDVPEMSEYRNQDHEELDVVDGFSRGGGDASVIPEAHRQRETQLRRMTLVEQLVDGGASRLTAERIVEIELGEAEPGRARRHTQSRR
jgi:hypothetical protein